MQGRQAPTIDPRFLYLGTGYSGTELTGSVLAVPFPSEGAFETQRAVDAARNAQNVVIGQMVGRSADKQNMKWNVLPRQKWWEMNRWIEANGMFFWCKYFSHNVGKWMIRRFYVGNISASPAFIDANTGLPAFYLNCTFNVIDTGEETTIVVSSQAV